MINVSFKTFLWRFFEANPKAGFLRVELYRHVTKNYPGKPPTINTMDSHLSDLCALGAITRVRQTRQYKLAAKLASGIEK